MERDVELNLIQRALAGDRFATGELIRAQQGPLYAYMLRMCRRVDLAEDVTQEALYKAIKNLHRYDARWRFSTWVFTIARRLWLNMQDRKSPAYDSDLMDVMPSVAPVWGLSGWAPEQRDGAAQARVVIERAMDALPDVQREAVVLCHQLGWPLKLAADLMGLPEGTIKSHLFRARGTLREQLASWYAREHRARQRDDEHEQEIEPDATSGVRKTGESGLIADDAADRAGHVSRSARRHRQADDGTNRGREDGI